MQFPNILKALKYAALLLVVQIPVIVAAEDLLTLSANNSLINMQTSAASFAGSVVIHRGNMKITADNLSQQSSSGSKQEKMLLSGNPARVTFKQQGTNLDIHIAASNIIFFPEQGLLELSGNGQLKTLESGKLQTSIAADEISVKLTDKKIENIYAKGSPVKYQFSPPEKETIVATAEQLNLNQITGDVELYNAKVNQGSNQLQAGQIQVDGKTGNLSANSSGNTRPSISLELELELELELDKNKLEKKQQQKQGEKP